MIYSLALVYGVFNAFDLPARQAYLVDIAGKDDLANAIALNSGAFNSARIVGPAVAGVLVAWLPGVVAHLGVRGWFHTPLVGEAGCFWINALSYVAMLWGLARMRPGRREPAPATGAWEHLREGVRYALANGTIRRLLVLLGFMSGFGWQYTTLLPVYAREILRAGADTYGALVSAFGLGSLLSTVVLTREQGHADLRRNLFVGLGTAGVALAAFAWSRVLAVSLVAGFFAGFGLILYVASTNTMLQLTLEDRLRGRVMSLYTLMLLGLAPIGALVVGFIAQHWSAPIATSFCAIVLLSGTLYVSSRIRLAAQRDAATVTRADTSEPVG
jgi:predicted MFS family arabinose efflux permease